MKGIVFVELLAMAEAAVGEETLDEVLDGLDLDSGGAYSRVGSCSCGELMTIVEALSARTGLSSDDLQRAFGEWMLGRFVALYPQFFGGKASALDMLEAIENEVHVEVRKLYPDAELPRFEAERIDEHALRMHYRSERPLVAFCEGVIRACGVHFGVPMSVEVRPLSPTEASFDVRLEQQAA